MGKRKEKRRYNQRGRQGKDKAANPEKTGKDQARPDEVEIAPELIEQLKGQNEYQHEVSDASAALGKRKADARDAGDSDDEELQLLSKSKLKRLRKIVEAKRQKQERAELLESLSKHVLKPDQAALLRRTTELSQPKQSLRQALKHELKLERAGVLKHVAAMDTSTDAASARNQDAAATSADPTQAQPKTRGKALKFSLLVPHQPKETEDAELDEDPSDTSDSDSGDDSATDAAVEAGGDQEQLSTAPGSAADGDQAASTSTPEAIDRLLAERRGDGKPSAKQLMKEHARKLAESGGKLPEIDPRRVVAVNRKAEIQATRVELPIIKEEYRIIEAVQENNIVVICGETGSGKTTQVPQFLYEAGYTRPSTEGGKPMMIGITEPRRIAAVSMANRVADELNLSKDRVSYQIRYEGNVTDQTQLKFMTDGVLQKEISQDFALRRYSVIIVDEAHERSMHTDILLGLLSRIVPLRQKMHEDSKKRSGGEVIPPLKLIIMSATLRVQDFTENPRLFPGTVIPVVSVDARQHPVTVHFSKRTKVDEDPVNIVYKKVCQIHRRLPAGDILVFMTGQAEIHDVCYKLRQRFPTYKHRRRTSSHQSNKGGAGRRSGAEESTTEDGRGQTKSKPPTRPDQAADEGDIEGNLSDTDSDDPDEESDAAFGRDADEDEEEAPLHVLPLYSNLSTQKQRLVFQDVPEGSRLCVVATNVAETSLTIPNIRYVVDTGLVKTMHYDKDTGVSEARIEWTSKASARQRAGRAGRTGPGHCYRLYSSAVFNNDFPEFSDPEILRLPTDGLVLQMKAMHIDRVINFPFPTPPSVEALKAAEAVLVQLNALDKAEKKITAIGRAMSTLPVAPRYAKMLLLAKHYNVFDFIAAIVAALTVKDLLLQNLHNRSVEDEDASESESEGNEDDAEGGAEPDKSASSRRGKSKSHDEANDEESNNPVKIWRAAGTAAQSDLMALLAAMGACDFESSRGADLESFCEANAIRFKAIRETLKLRRQLHRLASSDAAGSRQQQQSLADTVEDEEADDEKEQQGDSNGTSTAAASSNTVPQLSPPSSDQTSAIRQIVLAAFGDCVARLDQDAINEAARQRRSRRMHPYQAVAVPEHVFIHPTSGMRALRPQFVVYHQLVRTAKHVFMKDVTVIDPTWLMRLVPHSCDFSKPLPSPAPFYDAEKDDVRCVMSASFGPYRWKLPAQQTAFPKQPDRFRHFAMFLLDGKVLPKLGAFAPFLKNKPSIMIKPWSKERVVALLQALVDADIDSKKALETRWKTDPHFLLKPYSLWLDSSKHNELTSIWPPVEGEM